MCSKRKPGVLLQYSLNGGVSWFFIQEFYYNEYLSPTHVHIPVPTSCMTSHTRLRWWQPKHEVWDNLFLHLNNVSRKNAGFLKWRVLISLTEYNFLLKVIRKFKTQYCINFIICFFKNKKTQRSVQACTVQSYYM